MSAKPTQRVVARRRGRPRRPFPKAQVIKTLRGVLAFDAGLYIPINRLLLEDALAHLEADKQGVSA
jgi:hypothetical protein